MYKLCALIAVCCAFCPRGSAAPRSAGADRSAQGAGDAEQVDRLQEEVDGQESILSKLLGDYDKVKALSEGSDCRCKCVVRPLSRSACRRIEEGSATAQDFFTVETITSGPECKCACIAPPSAVNPCEGEFRLKTLREAGRENVKLSTILELLEGSFYGMDLLKLHSITNKLLDRMDHIEKGNYEEKFIGESMPFPRTDGSAQLIDVKPLLTPKNPADKEASQVSKTGPNGMIIRGMTFYKSEPDLMVADDGEPGENRDCKDTLATISDPVTHNTYGRNEGAWMKDPKSDNGKIYVTNFYYGNNLLEFRNMEVFKQGRFTNSYKLPYNWIGTGHVVYDGAFYYNRAFSRDIIKYDLRHRHVASWTMLHDALFEESSSPWEWRSHSDIDFAVDESGLWIIYPAMDDEGFLQEVIVLSRLNPSDLSMQRETTWRTGFRRNRYGNCFIVCGVLYAVDSKNRREANLEYAFDTHTNTQMIPRMPFINNYTYTTQIDYNPKEGVLYAWDNGHQVTYNIKFAYVDP
ncbi:hypothetical protein F2P81_005724 [Scophthalmus maximus]|uniref:Olfactomedin-like domain-containing protein n=1 Tax=Scophthalmus maximus TaxID=52904 RepID=A0A6A4TJD9_SCOMX|nr:hypothetical protein F2P81_005724 [Scophthalmus maximus]